MQIDFKNPQQKKFYYIKRAMMMGNVFIPRLESAVKFITFRLEEMERDTFAMLKTVKRKMSEREENVEAEVIAN